MNKKLTTKEEASLALAGALTGVPTGAVGELVGVDVWVTQTALASSKVTSLS